MNFPGSQLVGLCWVKVKLQLLAPRAVIRSRVLSAGGCFNNEGVSPAIYLIPIHRTIHCGVVTGTLSLSLLIRMLYLSITPHPRLAPRHPAQTWSSCSSRRSANDHVPMYHGLSHGQKEEDPLTETPSLS